MMEGIGFYCGIVMRWFRDGFCELESAQPEPEGIDVYALLERNSAALPPGANGVFGIFSNVMQANRWVHASPGSSALTSAAPRAPNASGRSRRARPTSRAGTCRLSRRWRGFSWARRSSPAARPRARSGPRSSPTLGIPVRIPVVKESTALGAATYAGTGSGLYDGDAVTTAARIARLERTVEPRPEAVSAYDELLTAGASCIAVRSNSLKPVLYARCGAPPEPKATQGHS